MSEHVMAAGTVLAGRYEVEALLGAGGFGATYQARDRARFGATCVVKELLPMRQANETARRLFEREARLLADLSHPQIPKLDAYFEHEGRFILIQEFVDGETLAERLQRETRISEGEVRQIVLQLLDVLGYLHARVPPVIHRDIKPANIILARDGRVVLIDFGAVREAVGRDETHTSIGTAGYTPLEQAAGRATPASDCYALGATALHMVSGTHPLDWHDRVTGQLDFHGRVPCTPSFEAFLTGMLSELPRRVPDARAARELLLGGATVIRERVPVQGATSTVPAEGPGAVRSRATPAEGKHGASHGEHAPAAPAAVTGRERVVPPAPPRMIGRVALPLVAVVAGVVGWIVYSGKETAGEPSSEPAATSAAPTTPDAPAGGRPGEGGASLERAAASTAGTACAQPATVAHRTESQFDLHILCPAGWSASYVAPMRATRLSAPDRSTEVWAGLWRPAGERERPEEFGERWRAAMSPQLGAVTLEVEEQPDPSLVRYSAHVAGEGRVRTGSLQIEKASVGASSYMTWSLLLGATDAARPMALQVLGSIDFRDPAAPPAGNPGAQPR